MAQCTTHTVSHIVIIIKNIALLLPLLLWSTFPYFPSLSQIILSCSYILHTSQELRELLVHDNYYLPSSFF